MRPFTKTAAALALCAALLLPAGCTASTNAPPTDVSSSIAPSDTPPADVGSSAAPSETQQNAVDILLADGGITVDGIAASTDPSDAVYVGADIVYYEDGTDETYGEGEAHEMHSADEAAAHTVVTITQAGSYRLSGTLSRGQIAIDLGEDVEDDPSAVVTLLLDGVDVTCTVAPALIFYNVYEPFEADTETAQAVVDTSAAGANVVIAAGSVNSFDGSHVARIYEPGTEDKLHKYDAAFYSKMTMNVSGDDSGVLNITADNEGLDSEMHLTINGGTINITSQNDGINTNEDYVSVTTVNGGVLSINAGLGEEGDGIDSNGWIVINGGSVTAAACETAADGGIDAENPIVLNGGSVYSFGTMNGSTSSDSAAPYMELSFASTLSAGTLIEVRDADGEVVWSATTPKRAQALTLTCPELELDGTYSVYADGVEQGYASVGAGMGMGMPGGFGGAAPEMPEDFAPQDGEIPEVFDPENMTPPEGERPEMPEGFDPENMAPPSEMPEGFDPDNMAPPSGMPEGFDPNAERPEMPEGAEPPQGGFGGGRGQGSFGSGDGVLSTEFVLTPGAMSFSGVRGSVEE